MVTENGWVDKGEMEDDGRIEYFHDHLKEVQNAILNDGCNVKGYIGKTYKRTLYLRLKYILML